MATGKYRVSGNVQNRISRSRPQTPVTLSSSRTNDQCESALPPTLLSGVVWHNSPGLFSKWKEVFMILNRDTIRWHHIQRTVSINHHQVAVAMTHVCP